MFDALKSIDAFAAAPELLMAVAVMALLMLGAFRTKPSFDLVSSLAMLVLALAAALVIFSDTGRSTAFHSAFVMNTFTRFMKTLVLFASGVAILVSLQFMKTEKIARFEYPVLVLMAATGMMIMISANDMIALYLGIELQSLSLYVIASINRDSARSSEAGLKYFVLGALSSGLLLYGISLIYGFTGMTSFAGIANVVKDAHASLGLTAGLVFLITGLAFKVSAVPFHMWTPDVYEGAPTPVTALFASAPKVAAMALFIRVLMVPFAPAMHEWQQVIVFIAIATMVLGAFAAIGQTNIKRLLAYSSIGHMGFALAGLASASSQGVRGTIIYMAIYLIMTLGTFACVIAMRNRDGTLENIDDLAGLATTNKTMAFVLAALMFSLAGVPPLAGFFGKYFVLVAVLNSGLMALAVIAVISSVISAFYYLRIVKVMYFDKARDEFEPVPVELRVIMVLSAVFVVAFIPVSDYFVSLASAAALSLP